MRLALLCLLHRVSFVALNYDSPGTHAQPHLRIFIAPSTCIFIVVILVLLLARREPTEAEAQETTSSKKLAMYLITFLMAASAVCAFVSMLINEWMVPLQAHAYTGADIEAKGTQRKFG